MTVDFRIYRDCDAWRLRKWVIEMFNDDGTLDRRRTFGGPGFSRRCFRKMRRMVTMRERALEAMIRLEEEA